MKITFTNFLAVAAGMLICTKVLAQSSVTLDVAGLDLSRPEVASAVYSRITRSAALVCRGATAPWDGTRATTLKRCVATAVEDALKQANAPVLTAMHLSKTRRGEFAALKED